MWFSFKVLYFVQYLAVIEALEAMWNSDLYRLVEVWNTIRTYFKNVAKDPVARLDPSHLRVLCIRYER